MLLEGNLSANKGWSDNTCILYKRNKREKFHLNLGLGRKNWKRIEENDKTDKDSDKKRKTGILIASYGRACVCICKCMRASARACRSLLGHPTLFNVTLTSKPCVQALNADRMEQVFI